MKNTFVAGLFVLFLTCLQPVWGQSDLQYETGNFTNNSVLALAGSTAEEIYGVTLAGTTAQTTANGYTFGPDSSSNISFNTTGDYSTFLSGGGTSGDTAFDAVLNTGRVGGGTGTITLNNLTQGVAYQVLFLEADTRSGVGARTFSITQGSDTSASQQYAYVAGSPSLGGYVLCTFTATGPNATFTVNNAWGHQLNAVLVSCVGTNTPFLQYANQTFTNNSVLAEAGSPMEEIYGVSLGNSSTETTANGYNFAPDTSEDISYSVTGGYHSFLSGGGTSGDAAFDAVLNNGRVGTGTATLTLNNLAQGVAYRVLFLESDTRSGMGARTFSISQGGDTGDSQQYAYVGGSPSLGGYVLCTFIATGMTETFTVNNGYGHQLNAVMVCCVGANTPFKTIEGEWGTLGGAATVVSLPAGTLPTQHTETLEASGRAYAHLATTGDSITLTNNTSVTASGMVLRVCMPDAPTGGGITATLDMYVNGEFRQAITINNAESWTYSNGWTDNNPADGVPRRLFTEVRTTITGTPIAPGSTITFEKDSDNTASYYDIDLVDLEDIPPALTQPANTLSITDYGAVANSTTDSTTYIQNCINAAEAAGKGVWIPEGTFYTNEQLTASNITISGAGMWYSMFYRNASNLGSNTVRNELSLTNCNINNLSIDCNAIGRNLANGADYAINMSGANGWVIDRVWFHNLEANWLTGTNGTIQNCRSENSWADGINLNNSTSANSLGKNLTAQNNYIRGSCDDGIAVNAQNGEGVSGNMVNAQVLNNTSVATTGASNISIYGGSGNIVENNLACDPTENYGIHAGTFGTAGNPEQSALIQGNFIVRAPGYVMQGALSLGANGVATFNDNVVYNAQGVGVTLYNGTATLTYNLIDHPATKGIWIPSGQTGSAELQYNTVADLNTGQNAFENDSSATFTTTSTDNTGF